ncbi:hypothetical protein ATI61_105709 [Archangium gephyra]|uniref:Haem-binding uptake Tiki superfamily ChaN domain-containing protein n=1 Tax=Archangium gephyra TaxID=48 RepID=A0AAC8THJ2_9BACT|nr:hypothetical protein [Archangium gephyra]AKJ06302.1 Hypothetical protein AA314_07928 [Archangium gephyra]REG32381.1 hypothetical protein ATI61_105709 [Archangium gephyra]
MLTAMTLALGVLLSAPPENPSEKPSTVHEARPAPVSADGVSAILEAAHDHPIVGLGERHHMVSAHEFLRRLVRDPRFPSAFQDIVVEFGNPRYQGVMDRYIAGESVPAEELRLAWRNTTQLLVWDSPLYEQFFTTVRDVNRTLPADKRLRVLLGDPPIDWEAIQRPEDFPRDSLRRDPETFRLIEKEVLSQGRRALVIIGNAHLLRRSPLGGFQPLPLEKAGLAEALAQRYPGKAFLVWTVAGAGSEFASRVARWRPGTLVRLAGTSLGAESSSLLLGRLKIMRMVDGKRVPMTLRPEDCPPLEEQVDAVLYLGTSDKTAEAPPEVYRDEAYVAELRRRAAILHEVFGMDQTPEIDELVKAAKKTPRRSR